MKRIESRYMYLLTIISVMGATSVLLHSLDSTVHGFSIPHLHKIHHTQSPSSRIFSSNDDFTLEQEEYSGDREDKFTYASSEPFQSESDSFQAANALLATTDTTTIELQSEISNSFLQYALSIILGRALPDARDGLKPVHRRILYAMNELNLSPSSSHRKCARVVGEVLGKFHPHGDMAVYDALVRMAQDFSSGTPLIDGHGNFGSVDADPAAAMRYTECKLTPVAQTALMDDLHYNTVDFIPNFDGNEVEPTVLPAKLPILLLNGCSGIAVGMATNVPPHNLRELLHACRALASSRKEGVERVSDDALFEMIPGPDFPTGATIMGTSGARQLYETGNGGIVVRANTQLEKVVVGRSKQMRSAIVVTSLPFQVNKAALLEKLALLVNDKKLEGIADLRDESDRDGMRVVIELKRDAVAAVVLNNLYKKTPLQTSFSGNFLALMGSGTKPQRFTLRDSLECFLDFRFETIRRKCAFQLQKVESRAHIVDGLLTALTCVDDVIDMIRSAPDQNAAREALMSDAKEALGLSREQADAVLKLQLGQLTRLNKDKLEEEKTTLESSQKELNTLMTKDEAVLDVMNDEFENLIKKFGVDRKTRIEVEEEDLNEMDFIRNSRSVIVVTRGGYIKRMPLKTFERQGRGTRGKKGTSDQSQENEVAHCFTCNDHDTLLMVTRKGTAFGLRAFQVPTGGRTAKGTPIPAVLPVTSDDTVTTILPVSLFSNDEYIVLATKHGWIKKTPLKAFENLSIRGKTIASLDEGDSLIWAHKCTDSDDILIGTTMGMATRFEAAKLRPSGRTSRGVHAVKLRDGDTVAGMNVLNSRDNDSAQKSQKEAEYVLAVTSHGYGKRVPTSEFRTIARGAIGVIAIKFKSKPENDTVSCLRVVREDDEILLITSKGIMVRQKVKDIASQSRTATGVLVQKVDVENGDYISSVSIVPKYEERDD